MDNKKIKNFYDEKWITEHKNKHEMDIGWKYEKTRIDSFILCSLNTIKPQNILEIGIGKGDLALKLSKSNEDLKSYTGTDISIEGVKIAEKNVENPKFSFFVGDCTDLNLNSKYDLVIFSEVLEHIKNQPKALNEINNALKTGGYLILTTPNPNSIYYILPKLIDKFNKRGFGSNQIIENQIKNKDLLELLEETNFEIIDSRGLIFQLYSISLLENKLKRPIDIWRRFSEYIEEKNHFSNLALYQTIIARKIDSF